MAAGSGLVVGKGVFLQIVKDYRDNKVLSACEKLRYSEIRREMYNITDAVLAATLKDLTESVWVIVKPKV